MTSKHNKSPWGCCALMLALVLIVYFGVAMAMHEQRHPELLNPMAFEHVWDALCWR